jgi:hypothetical protein
MTALAAAVGLVLVLGLNAFSGNPEQDQLLRRAEPAGQVNVADLRDVGARRAEALHERRLARARRLAAARTRSRRLAARAAAAALPLRTRTDTAGTTGYQGFPNQGSQTRPAPAQTAPKPAPAPPKGGSGGGTFDDSG